MATAPPQQSPFSSREDFIAWLRSRSKRFWIVAIVVAWFLGSMLWLAFGRRVEPRTERERPARRATLPIDPNAPPPVEKSATKSK